VRTLINAYGTLTVLGGTRIAPEVTDAMAQAARHFVDVDELLAQAGAHLARLIGVEAVTISSGAAAGLALATAACIAGDDPALIGRLPDTRGIPHRVAVHSCHRNGYDQAISQAGAELVEFGSADGAETWQLEAAIDEETVAVAYFVAFETPQSLPLEDVIDIAHRRDLPVIVDAAAELPPVRNLRHYCALGSDLVVFSGGKALEGPQSSGLVLGTRDLIRACALNGNPRHSVGRPMKVGKEEIIGLVVAVERYLARDQEADRARWEAQVATIVAVVAAVPGARAWRVCPIDSAVRPVVVPRACVSWDPGQIGLTVEEAVRLLRAGDPAIAVGSTTDALVCNPQTLAPGEEHIVASSVRGLLEAHRTA
jgi:L-seryl-tRNA(Ser) seleniumtransferase